MGRAEAAGIDYDGETPQSMSDQLNSILTKLRSTTTPMDVQAWLPRGGARNALDCALWDLQAKRSCKPAWTTAGLEPMRSLTTACTIGLGSIEDTRRHARKLAATPLIKIKVDGVRHVDSIRAVREEAPMARLVIDANQSWNVGLIQKLLPDLLDLGVECIEQPIPRGSDAELDGLNSPIPIVADESCTDRHSLPLLVNRYQGVNIKLDKTGGLTEALALAHEARILGFAAPHSVWRQLFWLHRKHVGSILTARCYSKRIVPLQCIMSKVSSSHLHLNFGANATKPNQGTPCK
jgi:L-alanine-DL-glutamate epimerase-like enolase superfamily enzyme